MHDVHVGDVEAPIRVVRDPARKNQGLNDAGLRPSLYDLAEYRNNRENKIICFHGTSSNNITSLQPDGSAISTHYSGGRLGEGFYITFNPNEAFTYACATADRTRGTTPVVYELHINNARGFLRGGGNPDYPQHQSHVPFPRSARPIIPNQYVQSPRNPGGLVDIRRTSDTRNTHFEQNDEFMGKEQFAIYFQHDEFLRQNIDITMTRVHQWPGDSMVFNAAYQNINTINYIRRYDFGLHQCTR